LDAGVSCFVGRAVCHVFLGVVYIPVGSVGVVWWFDGDLVLVGRLLFGLVVGLVASMVLVCLWDRWLCSGLRGGAGVGLCFGSVW